MKTLTVPLAEICEVNPSPPNKLGSNDPCSFVPMEAVDDWSATIERTIIRPYQEVAKGFTSFAEHDVLIAKITPCMENGKCAIARRLSNGIGFGSTEFHVLRATNRVLPEWLLYFWRLPATRQLAERNMTGSGGQQRVPTGFLEELAIPLPPIPEQRRIAAQLEQADRLRRTRRYTLELSDTFLPATFRKLFGDPRENPNNWPDSYLSDLCTKFSDGPFGSNLKSEHYTPDGVRIVRLQNIGIGDFVDDDKAFISQEHFNSLRKHECRPDDVLIATLGEPNLRACLQPNNIPIALNKADCIQARPDPAKADKQWFCWLLNMPSTLLLAPGLVHGQTRSRISMGQLADVPVPVPPIYLQQHFAKLVAQHERLRATQRESLRQAEHLFQTLLHRAFAGVE